MGGEGRGELNKREGWNTMDWMLPGEFFFFFGYDNNICSRCSTMYES